MPTASTTTHWLSVLALCVGLLAGGCGNLPRSSDGGDHVPGELLVRFAERTSESRRDALLDQVGGSILASLDLVPDLYHVRVSIDVSEAIRILEASPDVLYAEPNHRLYPASDLLPSDESFDRQWALHLGRAPHVPTIGRPPEFTRALVFADTDAPSAWRLHTGDEDFVVAVLDTGLIDTTGNHEFAGNVWEDANGAGFDFVAGTPGVAVDTKGHGTAVAAIIGARANNHACEGPSSCQNMVGVNWRCRLMPLRFIGSGTVPDKALVASGSVALAIQALGFAVDRGVKLSNNSYGAYALDPADLNGFKQAIQAAGAAGHLFVAAAGNGGEDLEQTAFHPASFALENMIVVTSSNHRAERVPQANFGPSIVDVAAPGYRIYSRHKYGYATDDGTSYATAYVTGAAALVWSLNPGWTRAQVKNRILESALRHAELEPYVEAGRVLHLGNLITGKIGKKNPDPHPSALSHSHGVAEDRW